MTDSHRATEQQEDAKLKALLVTLQLLIETLTELDRVKAASRNDGLAPFLRHYAGRRQPRRR